MKKHKQLLKPPPNLWSRSRRGRNFAWLWVVSSKNCSPGCRLPVATSLGSVRTLLLSGLARGVCVCRSCSALPPLGRCLREWYPHLRWKSYCGLKTHVSCELCFSPTTKTRESVSTSSQCLVA